MICSDPVRLPSIFNHENLEDLQSLAFGIATKPLDNPIFSIVPRSVPRSLSHPAYKPNNCIFEKGKGTDEYLSWTLPAHGSRKRNCNSLLRTEVCAGHDFVNGVIVRCHRPSCPVCYPWAVTRASDRARDYVRGVLELRDSEGRESPLYHVEISEPPDLARSHVLTDKDFSKNRRQAQKHLLKFFEGGVLAFHPFRQNKKGSDESLSMDGKVQWRDGPHYHALVVGKPDLTKVAEFHAKTGWVLKVIGGLDGEVPRDRIGAVLTYVLSHAGVAVRQSGRSIKQLSYFGDLSTRAVHKVDEIRSEVLSECPHCSGPLYNLMDTVWFLRGYASPIMRTIHHVVLSREKADAVQWSLQGLDGPARLSWYLTDPRFVVLSDSKVVDIPRSAGVRAPGQAEPPPAGGAQRSGAFISIPSVSGRSLARSPLRCPWMPSGAIR